MAEIGRVILKSALARATAGAEGARYVGAQLAGATGTTVQAMLEHLLTLVNGKASQASLDSHTGAASGAHAATALSFAGSTNVLPGTVEAAIDELDAEKADVAHLHDARYVRTVNNTGPDANGNVAVSGGTSTSMTQATETALGGGELADQTESDAGTDHTRIMTPLRVAQRIAAIAKDAAANIASLRSLGTGPQQACAGDDARLFDARVAKPHATSHGWGGADAVRPTVRAQQAIGAAGQIAVGTDHVIPVTATAPQSGITMAQGGFDGHPIRLINRSAHVLTFDVPVTSNVAGGGEIANNSEVVMTWDANYGGTGIGRWVRLPRDSAAAVASLRSLGTGAQQAAAGNDSRLSDARTPTAHAHQTEKVDVFTANGTWTKPANLEAVTIVCVAGGGGGGAGRRGLAASVRCGGGGGASGGRTQVTLPASVLPASVTVNVGAGGQGAPGVTTDSTSGGAGAAGGHSWFGTAFGNALANANGGGGGAGGAAAVGVQSSGGFAAFPGVNGGLASGTGTAGPAGANGPGSPGAGGAGGGITSGDLTSAGGAGGIAGGFVHSNAAGGTDPAGAGAIGATNGAGTGQGGGGGGGGASSKLTNPGGTGGAGGNHGAGGGGGGASLNGLASGAGGNGAPGIVVVISHMDAS